MGDDHDVALATRRPVPQRALLANRGTQPDSGRIKWPRTGCSGRPHLTVYRSTVTESRAHRSTASEALIQARIVGVSMTALSCSGGSSASPTIGLVFLPQSTHCFLIARASDGGGRSV